MNDIELLNFNDVIPENVEWLYYPYIPSGKITILCGNPGCGKTTFALALSALLSKGAPLPLRTEQLEPINIIYQTGEDGIEDTIVPMLNKFNADNSRIASVSMAAEICFDNYAEIEKAIIKHKAKLMVFDPLQAFVGNSNLSSVNEMRNLLRKIGDIAYNTGCAILILSHLEGVVLPKREHKEIQVFTPTEEFVIIKMSCFEDLGLAIVFDFYTGLRIGELCGLKWGDFDFEKRSFKVQRTLQRVQKKKENIQPDSPRTEIVNGELKTKNSYREIPIPNAIFDELLNLKKQQEKEKELYGELYQDMGYVFSNKCGGFVEPSYLRSVYNRILKKSGIRHLNFHTIRHTFATRAIEAGAPAKVVSEILGHSSIQITMDLYCHPSLDAKRDVIENRSLL